MSILSKLTEDMKTAIKAQDKSRLSTIRMLIAQIKQTRIDSGEDLTEEQEMSVLMSAAKKRKEAIEAFQKSNRLDLVNQEQKELEIINQYLPEQMSDESVKEKINEIIESIGATSMKDLGKVMAEAMKALKGKADGKKVQEIVRSILT